MSKQKNNLYGWETVSYKKVNKEIDLPDGEDKRSCTYHFYYRAGKPIYLFVEIKKHESTLYSLETNVGEVVGINMTFEEAIEYVDRIVRTQEVRAPNKKDKSKAEKLLFANLATAGQIILNHFEIDHQGVAKTPERYANALIELLKGYDSNPLNHVRIFDDVKTSSIIIAKDVSFFSMCEHHMLPFFGTVSMGYIPKDDKVIGASKLARIFDCFACRLQVQERIGEQFCDFIEEQLHPLGVICLIKATHLCIASRGVKKETASFVTNAVRGVFLTDPAARAEFMSMVK